MSNDEPHVLTVSVPPSADAASTVSWTTRLLLPSTDKPSTQAPQNAPAPASGSPLEGTVVTSDPELPVAATNAGQAAERVADGDEVSDRVAVAVLDTDAPVDSDAVAVADSVKPADGDAVAVKPMDGDAVVVVDAVKEAEGVSEGSAPSERVADVDDVAEADGVAEGVGGVYTCV